MKKLTGQSGGVLVFTLLVISLLSILGLALLPLTVVEYKSSANFSSFEKAYFIAEAGVEEALAELEYHWNNQDSGENWIPLDEGEYRVKIQGAGMERTITSWGRVGNITRVIEAKVQKPIHRLNLEKLKDYALLSQGDIQIHELGEIRSEEGEEKAILGSWGNLYFQSAQGDGKVDLSIQGEIILNNPQDGQLNKNYPKNFPSSSKELVDLSTLDVGQYISWLKKNFNVVQFKPATPKDRRLDLIDEQFSSSRDDQVIIIEDYDTVTLGGELNGFIVVHKVDTLTIRNNSTINGMLIFTGADLKIPEFPIVGSDITVNGSMICVNPSIQKGNWKLQLNHRLSILENFAKYLPQDFESSKQESGQWAQVIHWREIDNQDGH